MKKSPAIQLRLSAYNEDMDRFSLIFDLLRCSLQNFSNENFRQFMKSARKPEEARVAYLLAYLGSTGQTKVADQVRRIHKRGLSSRLPITPTLKWAEYKGSAQLGLNASELVLRVALFEGVMKEIHRTCLNARPQLLSFVKPNRPITLKNLFEGGFERFKQREIERQVRETDRLRTKDKAKFFHRKLNLPWATDDIVKRLTELIEMRHGIVHQNPSHPVVDKDISEARQVFLLVPRNCLDQAVKVYPSHFKG